MMSASINQTQEILDPMATPKKIRLDKVALIIWIIFSIALGASMMSSKHGISGRVVGGLIGYVLGMYPLLIASIWKVSRSFTIKLILFSVAGALVSGWVFVSFPAPWITF